MSFFSFIIRVSSSSPDFPFRVGEKIRIKNPDGTQDTITLMADRTPTSRNGRSSPLFLAETSRQFPDSNKRQIGTPWTF